MEVQEGLQESVQEEGREEQEGKPAKNLFKELLELVLYVVCVALAAFFLYHYVAQQVEVEGHSMMDTLDNGEHLILEKLSYRFGDPKRFDIIVFRPYEDDKTTYYIKRIIGMPGETVQIIDSDIYINGTLLEEDYGKEELEDPGLAEEPIVLGEEEYFVMGDNRNNSMDSRDGRVGNVGRDAIMGRAWVRMWPLDKIGVLSHK